MLTTPRFEPTGIVSDNPLLAAQLSALFTREGRYLPVLDGPRLARPDASNEIIRRVNALVSTKIDRILLAGLPDDSRDAMARGWKHCFSSNDFDALANSLKGVVKRRSAKLDWGPTNLGVGLYEARLRKRELAISLEHSPETSFVQRGNHLLIACEDGNELSQVVASNLAFSCNASLLIFSALPKEECDSWQEDLYLLGEDRDASARFLEYRDRARSRLPSFPFHNYKQIVFVTGGFPWGMAVTECPTTHMFDYPDFGRSVVEGLWAAQSPARSARTALLIEPKKVVGSEIANINQSLLQNGTLTRVLSGPAANVHTVQTLMEVLPFDVIVIATHAGDAPGTRVTYEYTDEDGRRRRLTIDHAMGIGYVPSTDSYLLQQYERFHSLDGVDWRDTEAKHALPVGSAISSWLALGDTVERSKYAVHSESIPRVAGSMALQLNDNVWIVMVQGFVPGASPLILNNACSSWHKLSERLTFAGARAYIGTLFPVMDAEAQAIGQALFGAHIGENTLRALWLAQKHVYGDQGRRPYVMVGVPFTALRPNTVRSVGFLTNAYRDGIAELSKKAVASQFEEIRTNSQRHADFLKEDFDAFNKHFSARLGK